MSMCTHAVDHFQLCRSHTMYKPVRNFHLEWDVAITWQLRGLCSNYGMYVGIMESTWQLSIKHHVDLHWISNSITFFDFHCTVCHPPPPPPRHKKNITIGLSASIAFKIVNQSRCNVTENWNIIILFFCIFINIKICHNAKVFSIEIHLKCTSEVEMINVNLLK